MTKYRRYTAWGLERLRRSIALAPIAKSAPNDRVKGAQFAPLASGDPEDEIETDDQTEKEGN